MILAFLVAVASAQPPGLTEGPPYGPKTTVVTPIAACQADPPIAVPAPMRGIVKQARLENCPEMTVVKPVAER